MKKLIWCLGILLSSISLNAQQSNIPVGAENLDLSMGNLTNWKISTGMYVCDNPSAQDIDKTYSYEWDTTPADSRVSRIAVTGAVSTIDPILQCDGLLVNPDPGKPVIRIGIPNAAECNGKKGAAVEKLEYSYKITQESSILKYRFAAVLHIPSGALHTSAEFPTFSIDIKVKKADGSVAVPTCSSYQTKVNTLSTVLKHGSANCAASNFSHEYMYQPWTSALVDLRQYIGDVVTITIINQDCLFRPNATSPPAGGSHEAYAYFRAEAMDLKLSTMVCNEQDAQIAAPEDFASYKWSRSNNFPLNADATTPNIVSIPFNDMIPDITYSCTLSDEMGCAAIQLDTKLDPVVLKPSFDYTTHCGGKVEFTSTSEVSGDEMVNWLWDAGEGETNGEISNHTYSKPGDYTVKLTATTKNGCKESFTKNITVPYFPDLKINAEPNVCNGKDLYVAVENAEYDSDIEWSSTLSGQTFPKDDSFITNPTKSQIYSVKVTDQRGCQYTADKEVIVFDKTHVYIKGNDVSCPGEKVTLTLVGDNLKNIRWNVPNSIDKNSIDVYPNDISTYTVTAEDINKCEVSASHSINVHETPTIELEAPAVCKGDDATVKASGADSYLWSDPNYTSYSGGEIVVKNIQENTPIKVTGYNEFGCTSSKETTIVVNEIPVIEIKGDLTRCFDSEPFELTAHGADTYIWNSVEEGNTFTALSDRNHNVSVVGKVGICASEPLKVELTTLPKPSITVEDDDISICDGEEVTLKVTGADSYQWFNTDITDSELTVSPARDQIYTVKGVSSNGCYSDEKEINVRVNTAKPIVLHLERTIACAGQPDAAIIVAEGGIMYEWSSFPEREDVSSNKSDRLHISYEEPTTIKVKGVNEFSCSSNAEISLSMLPDPVLDFKIEPTVIDESKPEVRIIGVHPTSELSTWYWNMGDGSQLLETRDTIYTYDITARTEPFMVEVTAIDENGCRFEGEQEITIWKDVWAPDAFSPNGDGLNDKFYFLRTENINDCYFYIYNRLGEIVFEGHSIDDQWDGTYQGKPCPWGTYGWVLQYSSLINGNTRDGVLKGQVTIVK